MDGTQLKKGLRVKFVPGSDDRKAWNIDFPEYSKWFDKELTVESVIESDGYDDVYRASFVEAPGIRINARWLEPVVAPVMNKYTFCNACGGQGKHKLMCPVAKT